MALLITDAQVADILTMEDAIDAVEEAFRLLASGGASMPPRISTSPPASPGHSYLRWLMPGTLHEQGIMGAKILVASSPGTTPPRPARFIILLFDSTSGEMLAMVQGEDISRIRTGAVTAIGVKHLARRECSKLALFGSSKYAAMQGVGVCAVRAVQEISIFSPNPEHRQNFAKALDSLVPAGVKAAGSSEEALADADIVVTVTNAREPIFSGDLVQPGMHLSVVGSSIPDMREVDEATLHKSKVVVEFMDQALKEAGDLVIPISQGTYSRENIYAEMADVVAGKVRGRVSDDEITLFKFNGIAVEDIACAGRVYQLARERGVGAEFNF